MSAYINILIGWHICQHLNMSTFCQHSEIVYVDIYVGIFPTTRRICHFDVLAYMSASWCVDISVGIWTCQYIGQHSNKCADIYVNIFVFFFVLANMLTCPDADIYVDTSRCWHICQHIEMSAHSTSIEKHADIYVNTFFECCQICRHIQMPTHMSTY